MPIPTNRLMPPADGDEDFQTSPNRTSRVTLTDNELRAVETAAAMYRFFSAASCGSATSCELVKSSIRLLEIQREQDFSDIILTVKDLRPGMMLSDKAIRGHIIGSVICDEKAGSFTTIAGIEMNNQHLGNHFNVRAHMGRPILYPTD